MMTILVWPERLIQSGVGPEGACAKHVDKRYSPRSPDVESPLIDCNACKTCQKSPGELGRIGAESAVSAARSPVRWKTAAALAHHRLAAGHLHIEDDRLIALPSYRKWHSYGQYVFDGWADACARAGIDYYPKLLIAVPFQPVSSPRLLAANVEDGFELLKSCRVIWRSKSFQRAHQLH